MKKQTNYTIDDVINGELGTKFHYTKVEKEDSGLTDDMLLLLDDKILNKYLPLKKKSRLIVIINYLNIKKKLC